MQSFKEHNIPFCSLSKFIMLKYFIFSLSIWETKEEQCVLILVLTCVVTECVISTAVADNTVVLADMIIVTSIWERFLTITRLEFRLGREIQRHEHR